MPHNRLVPDHEPSPEESPERSPTGAPEPSRREPEDTPSDVADDVPLMPTAPPRRATGLQVGYRADEVDAFLAELLKAVDRDPPGMAPYEVADARFRATHLRRRYRMRSVDDYLEQAQAVLRHRHGHDAVADIEGHLSAPRHVPTGWIYGVALVLVVVIVAFALTQL
jgi:hypothetical protein